MRISPVLAILLLAGTAQAQTMMPIPPFVRTFSSSSLSRGFYFQAPVDFSITGLRVPDETNHGTQHVEVFVMQTMPPAFSTSATAGSVFYANNQPSSQIIPTAIPVLTGEWVGVLGACGDTSMMHNSYAATGGFTSSILGTSVLIQRFLTQTNLAQPGTHPYSTENSFEVSRVEVYVGPSCIGSIQRSGTGCPDSGGTVNTLTFTGCPDQGTVLTVELNISPSLNDPLFLIFGVSDQNWAGLVLPLDLGLLGAQGCFNYISHEHVLAGLVPISGQAAVGLQVPVAPYLVGIPTFLQGYHLDIGLNALNLATTNYIALAIG